MLCGKKKLDERKKQSECQLDRGFKKKKKFHIAFQKKVVQKISVKNIR